MSAPVPRQARFEGSPDVRHLNPSPPCRTSGASVPLASRSAHDGSVPPTCCDADYDAMFDARSARRQLAAYRRSGPKGTTRRLIDAIRAEGVDGQTVLDIGGGVEVVGFELLAAGADRLTGVDAARAHVAIARREAARRGLDDRVTFRHGDFVPSPTRSTPQTSSLSTA